MKSGIIVFARLNSMRLPRKALIKIAGIRLIDRVLNRVQKAEGASITVVATTDTSLDDQLVEYLEGRDVYIYRGSGSDVALRAACCANDWPTPSRRCGMVTFSSAENSASK